MEDIEDMFKNEGDQIESRLPDAKRKIVKKAKVIQSKKKEEPVDGEEDLNQGTQGDQNLQLDGCGCNADGTVISNNYGDHNHAPEEDCMAPGTQKVFVKTYGCSHNISDSEYMAGLLADYGFKIVDTMEDAHAVLLNSCTVKNPS